MGGMKGLLGFNIEDYKEAGTEAGDAVASGVAESGELNTVVGDTLSSEESKDAVEKSAQDLAAEFTKQFGSRYEAEMTFDTDYGKWTSQAAAVPEIITEENVRLGEQDYLLRTIIRNETLSYELRQKSGDELVRQLRDVRMTNDLLNDRAWAETLGLGKLSAVGKWIDFDEIVDKSAAIDSKMVELGDKAGTALKDGILTATERDTLQALAKEFEAMGGDASNALIQAVKKQDWASVGQIIGTETGKGFKDSLTGAVLGTGETRSLADIIAGGGNGISNLKAFQENTFQPALKSSFDEMHKIADSGYTEDIKLADAWITDKQKLLSEHADWFTTWQNALLTKESQGKIDAIQFYDEWAKAEKAGVEEVKKAKDESKDITDGLYYGTYADEGASYKDYVNEYGGYIGPTKLYGDYKDPILAAQKEAQAINEKYGVTTVGSITMGLELDTTMATDSSRDFEMDVQNSNPTMSLMLDTTVADAQFMNLFTMIETARPTVTVLLDFAEDDIAARVDRAVANALASA
jgi:hypothetical protein